MSNMSYCRFENTAKDLDDCLEAAQDGGLAGLSHTEKRGLRSIIESCKEIVDMAEEIETELDEEE